MIDAATIAQVTPAMRGTLDCLCGVLLEVSTGAGTGTFVDEAVACRGIGKSVSVAVEVGVAEGVAIVDELDTNLEVDELIALCEPGAKGVASWGVNVIIVVIEVESASSRSTRSLRDILFP